MNYIRHKSEESIEDYLETILILNRRLPAVRSIDVANELNFSNHLKWDKSEDIRKKAQTAGMEKALPIK